MASSKPIQAVEYKSGNHTFKVGDPILALTKSWGNPSLRAGRYAGIREGKRGRGVVVEYTYETQILVHGETGERYDYRKEPKYPTGSQYGGYYTPAYKTAMNEYHETIKQLKEGYVNKKVVRKGTTTLRRNRVFPGDVAIQATKALETL